MAINPGIPIPSAMPRVPPERPFNGAEDGEDEDVAVCTVEIVTVPQVSVPESTELDAYSVDPVIVGTDAEIDVERLERVAEDDPAD